MTLGEKRIRTNFNVSSSSLVDEIKQKSAHMIDLVESIGGNAEDTDERSRLLRLAQDRYEEATMWAVKAATLGK